MLKQRRENLVLFGVSALCGLIAALIAHAYLGDGREASPSAPPETTPATRPVVTVTHDIARGQTLAVDDLRVVRLPIDSIGGKALSEVGSALGRVALQPLFAGEWLSQRKLSSNQAKTRGVVGLLERGRRGIRIPADRVLGLLGVIQPGDHVDVIAVIPRADGGGMVGRTLLQNVTVLAGGQRAVARAADDGRSAEPEALSSIVLDVDPSQAEALALVLQVGKLQLVVRSGVDAAPVDTAGIDLEGLFVDTPPAVQTGGRAIEIQAGAHSYKEIVSR